MNLTFRDCVERVLAGAHWLDAAAGDDWHKYIDLERLDQACSDDCVVGQTAERLRSEYEVFLASFGIECVSAVTFKYGFDCGVGNGTRENMDTLTRAWAKLIAERLSDDAAREANVLRLPPVQWAEDIMEEAEQGIDISPKALAFAHGILKLRRDILSR